jgi:hypothetical protein
MGRGELAKDLVVFFGGGLITVLPLLALMVVLIFALKAGKATHETDGTLVMKYGILYRIVSPLALVLGPVLVWVAIAIKTGAIPTENPNIVFWVCGGLGTVFSLAAVPLLLETYQRRVWVNDDGVRVRGWFGTKGPLAWDDVREVTFSETNRSYTLKGKKLKLTVSLTLTGRAEFVEYCKAKLGKEHRKVFKEHGSSMFKGFG